MQKTPVLSVKAILLESEGSGTAPTTLDDDHSFTKSWGEVRNLQRGGGLPAQNLAISSWSLTGPHFWFKGWK